MDRRLPFVLFWNLSYPMFWETLITMSMVSEELKLLAYLCWSTFGAVTLIVILGMGADNFITSSSLLVTEQ